MGGEVFANGNEIACKAGDGKVIAAFPDVCLSPPSPPAGPIPVPYPNTSFSRDTQNGSRTVKIKGQEVMLKDQSFYKTSPLGDEAATRTFGGSVITHVITGKTYFVAWSMDVKFEGLNVDRHVDLTTSNHASPSGSTPPNPNLEASAWGEIEDWASQCACCHAKPQHSTGPRATMADWYTQNRSGTPVPQLKNGYTTKKGKRIRGFDELMKAVENRKSATPPCTCSGKVLPEPPCNVFRRASKVERDKIEQDWNDVADIYRGTRTPPVPPGTKINHLVPKTAGGCPQGDGNLQPSNELCGVCRDLDDGFTDLQGSHFR
jgi:Domain of unknown function (DUF4150)